MTFQAREESRQQGEPVHLYFFKYGPGALDFFAYTDAETDVTHSGVTYRSIPFDRDNIKSSGSLDNSDVTLRCPADSELANLFKVFPPDHEVSIILRQGHIGDPDNEFVVIWTGRIMSPSFNGNECSFNCQPVSTAMRRAGLRRHWQYSCPHALYGSECEADQNAATSATTLVSATANSVTLPSDWATPPRKSKYVGGMVIWTGAGALMQRRMVLRVIGDTLVLSGLVRDLVPGQEVKVVLGCNHRAGLDDDCIQLHNNILNYGGDPWIPTKNPLSQVNNFF